VIETERLLLRLPEPADAAAVARQITDPEVMRYIGPTGTAGDAAERIEQMRRAWDVDGFGRFVVVRRDTGDAVGRVGILVWDPATWRHGTRREIGADAEIELGWTFERAAWGHGFATEAATAVRDWTLRELRPQRLISLIHRENERSQRVAEKLGERYVEDVFIAEHQVAVQLWALPSAP
jgi:RimJ/RimL family protein N-acetyltransferase